MLLTANPRRIPNDLRIPPYTVLPASPTPIMATCIVRVDCDMRFPSRGHDLRVRPAAVPHLVLGHSLQQILYVLQPSTWVNNAKHMRYLHSIQTSAAIPDYYRALTSSATVFTDTARLIAFRSRCPLQGSKLTRCAAAPWPLSAIC